MTEEGKEFNSETVFEEGRLVGNQEADETLREEIATKLISSGYDSNEVQQALFSQDTDVYSPKRKQRGKVRCSAKQRAKMPQICRGSRTNDPGSSRRKHHTWASVRSHYRKTYDPAPRRKAFTRQGITSMLKHYVPPAVGIGKLALDYQAHGADLKKAGAKLKDGTLVDGMLKAVQYDIENFNSAEAMTRVKKVLPTVIGEVVGGMVARSSKVDRMLKGYGKVVGDSLFYLAGATVGKAALDPAPSSHPVGRPQPARQSSGGNPTGGF